MSWFNSFKQKLSSVFISSAAGEWAVTAMGCMVFADGQAEESELKKAIQVVANNPVIKNSLGADKGLEMFTAVVEAIKTEPTSMLATYLMKAEALAQKVTVAEDRNFALGTVIAIASADGEIEPPEHAMLIKFKAQLQATIDVPSISEIKAPVV
jgi:tellurite resistance protein